MKANSLALRSPYSTDRVWTSKEFCLKQSFSSMQDWADEARKKEAKLFASLEAAMEFLGQSSKHQNIESIFVIGGGEVRLEFLHVTKYPSPFLMKLTSLIAKWIFHLVYIFTCQIICFVFSLTISILGLVFRRWETLFPALQSKSNSIKVMSTVSCRNLCLCVETFILQAFL